MGAYTYMREVWNKKGTDVFRFQQRLRAWEYRHSPRIVKLHRPTRPDKARRLGFKSKPGFVVYRIRVRRGGRKKPVSKGIAYGKPRTAGINKLKAARSLQALAEQRVGKKNGAMRVLSSYWVNEDAIFKYFEVVCADPMNKAIRTDPAINWIVNPVHKHRECRGLTSAGKKARGFRYKGHKANKARPGWRRLWKARNTVKFWRYRK
eukprot:NODE_4562_length_771_cov_156.604037_g4539_i0.p1 GENE.NODE_4562_length_771_cov_156.604037_g4539_i0~~NODE_4562_length_771_cov_156.604037_g4539_i0.p1  ORF type:complete len:225 (+),score=55.54 NODE_4562_length_771_cov_156.604037_g4539_i0:58-675(+)